MKIIDFGVTTFIMMQLSVVSANGVDKLIKDLETSYRKQSMRIDFTMVNKPAEAKEEKYSGQLMYSSTYYKLDIPNESIYFDGESQWTYFKDRKEIQITHSTLEESAFHPLKYVELYKSKQFKVRIESESAKTSVLEFVPFDPNHEYHKVKLHISKKTKYIQKVEIYLKNGARYTVTGIAHTPTTLTKKIDYQLDVSKISGVHVEDLR